MGAMGAASFQTGFALVVMAWLPNPAAGQGADCTSHAECGRRGRYCGFSAGEDGNTACYDCDPWCPGDGCNAFVRCVALRFLPPLSPP